MATPLWRRNLWILLIAQSVVMIGISAAFPLLPLYVRELGITELRQAQQWSGIIQAAPFLVAVFAIPLWGTLADRYGRKLMVLRAVLGLAIVTGLMAIVQSVEQLLVVRLLQGALTGFIASVLALITATVPPQYAGYAISMHQGSIAAGAMVGPLIGGALADLVSIRSVFLLVACLALVSTGIVLIGVREPPMRLATTAGVPALRQNFRYALRKRRILQLLVMTVLAQAGIVFTVPIFPYYLEHLGATPHWLATITGVMLGVTGFFLAAMAPFWGRRIDRSGPHRVLRITIPAGALAVAAQGIVPSYWWILPFRVWIGIFLAGVIPALYAALNRCVPQERKAGIMGIGSSATLLGNLIGPLASGWIAATWSMEACFFVAAFLLFCVLALPIAFPLAASEEQAVPAEEC